MTNIINDYEKLQKNNVTINFKPGDTVCVNFQITEKGYKNRTQDFEGIVLGIKRNGLSTTCTLRKISFGEGVEKTFFIHSPTINWMKIKKYGVVKKSKIYYIKKLKGKALRIKERPPKRRDDRVA